MSIEVIGAGFGRTGTNSLQTALKILGYDGCYHMNECIPNGDFKFWIKAAKKEKLDFEEVFGRPGKTYKASCDYPSSLFWREQLAQYPDAKVILTVRDPEKWYKSASNTIFHMCPGPLTNWGIQVVQSIMGMREMQVLVHNQYFFRNCWEKESIIKCFNEHNEAVKRECPPDKLLVYEVSQGWEPLCKFLNKPIPDVPFPNVNDTQAFKRIITLMTIAGYLCVGVPTLLLAGGVYFGVQNGYFSSVSRAFADL